MRQEILDFYKEISPDGFHIEDLTYQLHIKGGDELNRFLATANRLAEEGLLRPTSPGYYRYVDTQEEDYREGIFRGYRKQYGFVITGTDQEDIYVAKAHMQGAMHNDKVRVKVFTNPQNGKLEGRISAILERANTSVVGTFDREMTCGFVIPDDERLGDSIYVSLDDSLGARSGAKVLVELIHWPENGKRAQGRITEILGYKGDIGLDINCIMAAHKIPFSFPDEVIEESKKIRVTVTADSDRLDLRKEQLVTIDGEDAKDLDDAVSCKLLPNGNFLLGVHIADVSHYVRAGSEIDKEAYKRGTSVYLVDRVIPMLPEVLSNGICSLNAHEDRNAMTCLMEINQEGQVVEYTISPSLIRVGRRCSYTEVYKAISQKIIPEDLAPFMDMLGHLYDLSLVLNRMRHRRGAIDFDFPEYRVLLDHDGTPLRIVKRERTLAERLIEECMLIANETVARHLRDTHKPTVYRIHEAPSPEKLATFQTVINHLGHNYLLDAESIEPRNLQTILEEVKGTEVEQAIQIMTLRSMQQAKYSIENVGHFGLASDCYTHFTSPIRRYPDLMVHRLLKANLAWKDGYSKRDRDEDFLYKAADHSSIQEQVAVEAERETSDLKKTQYMLPFVGELFKGKISSITSFGLFVELENGIDGLVHISMMRDDRYFYDKEHFVLVGQRSGKIYHLGQEVEVTLIKADVDKRQLDFVLGAVENLKTVQDFMDSQRRGRSERLSWGKGDLKRPAKRRKGKKNKKSKSQGSVVGSNKKQEGASMSRSNDVIDSFFRKKKRNTKTEKGPLAFQKFMKRRGRRGGKKH